MLLKRFIRRTEAQDLIEYALIAALLSICASITLQGIGINIGGIFEAVNTQVTIAGGPIPAGGGDTGSPSSGPGTGSTGGTPDSGNGGGSTGGQGNNNGSTGGTGAGS
jgi:Flp pilus assembly pilin Flp